MKLTNEGLSVWYGTADAPAPKDDETVARTGVRLVVGVHPPNPTNAVTVSYRVDRGIVQSAPGRELRVDLDRDAQYFAVDFPSLLGDRVEYEVGFRCGGRQVPAFHAAGRFPSTFRVASAASRGMEVAPPRAVAIGGQRFSPSIDFVGTVQVRFADIQFVGVTAAGMRVNFIVGDAELRGNGFRAKALGGASDCMVVRRDGVGVVSIRATYATDDGAMLDFVAGGYADLGEGGYERVLSGVLPDRAPLVITPTLTSPSAKYEWLNRVQAFGTGVTRLADCGVTYDLYVAAPQPAPEARAHR